MERTPVQFFDTKAKIILGFFVAAWIVWSFVAAEKGKEKTPFLTTKGGSILDIKGHKFERMSREEFFTKTRYVPPPESVSPAAAASAKKSTTTQHQPSASLDATPATSSRTVGPILVQ